MILCKDFKASGTCKASGMCTTVKALHTLRQMVTSLFLHDVFAEIINSQTPTPTAVKVFSGMMTTTPDYQF